MTEQLRIINRALWVDHGDGNLDALTRELPVWADEWAERIVAAVNGRRGITDPAELDALPAGSVILAGGQAWQSIHTPVGPLWLLAGGSSDRSSLYVLRVFGPATVLWTPENGDTE